MRVVIDTNIFVSMLIRPTNEFGGILAFLDQKGTILYSFETLTELINVLGRDKFKKYTTAAHISAFVKHIAETGELVTVTREVFASPDPKDNKFLALAACGHADAIISGDKKHLVSLESFEGIPILSPASFIAGIGR